MNLRPIPLTPFPMREGGIEERVFVRAIHELPLRITRRGRGELQHRPSKAPPVSPPCQRGQEISFLSILTLLAGPGSWAFGFAGLGGAWVESGSQPLSVELTVRYWRTAFLSLLAPD